MGQQLRTELSRIVDKAGPGADDARVALGDGPIRQRLTAAIRALAEHRGPDGSTCPSDAARAVGGADFPAQVLESITLDSNKNFQRQYQAAGGSNGTFNFPANGTHGWGYWGSQLNAMKPDIQRPLGV